MRLLALLVTLFLSGCATQKQVGYASKFGLTVVSDCVDFIIVPDPEVIQPKMLTHELPKKPSSGPAPAYACVEATIDVDGKLVQKNLVKTNNQEFAASFLVSLDSWTYEPPTKNGKPTTTRRLFSSASR